MIQPLSKYTSYIFTFLLTLGMILTVNIFAATPEQSLGFQGQLYSHNLPLTSAVNATFTFYDAPTGGNTTGSLITKTIPVTNGYFSTQFTESDTTGVDFNQQLYLEVSVNGTTLSPRTTVNPTVSSLKSFGTFSYASAPTVGPVGSLYFNSTSGELYVSNGTSWQLAGLASSTTQWVANGTSLNYMAGNVGIGTTTPSSPLTVVGDNFTTLLVKRSGSASAAGASIKMENRAVDATSSSFWVLQAGSGSLASGGNSGGRFSIGYNLTTNGPQEQFVISPDGNIGINTQVNSAVSYHPKSKLTVMASSTTESQLRLLSAKVAIVNGDLLGGIDFASHDVSLGGDVTASIKAFANTTHSAVALGTDLAFSVTNGTTTSEALRILGNGNVGIGTSSPSANLTISGTSTLGADYPIVRLSGLTSAVQFFSPNSGASTNRKNFAIVRSDYFDNAQAATSSTLLIHRRTDTGGFSATLLGLTTEGRLTLDVSSGSPQPETKLVIGGESLSLPQITLRSFRTAVVTNSIIGGFNFVSNDSDLTSPGSTTASILAVANQTHTASALGTDLSFNVTNGTSMTEALRILGNGNVGIGTSNPGTLLEVNKDLGTSTGQKELFKIINNGAAGIGMGYRADGTSAIGGFIRSTGSLPLFLETGGAPQALTLLNTGHFGVGTTSPSARLSVTGFGATTQVTFRTANSSNIPTFSILDNGNVGIGTTSPVEKLDVLGNVAITGFITTTTGANGGFSTLNNNLNYSGAVSNGRGLYVTAFGTNIFSLTRQTNDLAINVHGNFGVNTNNSSTPDANYDFIVTTGGNVGIGTTTPVDKFFVQGVAQSSLSFLNNIGYNDTSAGGLQLSGFFGGKFGIYVNNAGVLGIGTNNTGSPLVTLSQGGTLSTVSARISNNVGLPNDPTYSFSADIDTGLYNVAANTLNLSTGGIERLRIDSVGNVGIGTTSPVSKLSVAGAINSTDLLGGATTLSTDANGNIIRTPSDSKLKTNVETLTSALDKVNAMRGVSYTWLDTNRFGTSTEIGFIAQELETIVPEVVKSGGEYKSVNYQNLTALLTEAIKELSAKVTGFSEKFTTKQLCLEDVCINKDQLRTLLQQSASRPTPSYTPPAPEPSPEPTAKPDDNVETPQSDQSPEPDANVETPQSDESAEPAPTPTPSSDESVVTQ